MDDLPFMGDIYHSGTGSAGDIVKPGDVQTTVILKILPMLRIQDVASTYDGIQTTIQLHQANMSVQYKNSAQRKAVVQGLRLPLKNTKIKAK